MVKEHFQLSTKVMHLRMEGNEGDAQRVLKILNKHLTNSFLLSSPPTWDVFNFCSP